MGWLVSLDTSPLDFTRSWLGSMGFLIRQAVATSSRSRHRKNRRKLLLAPQRQTHRERHIMRLGCCGCQRRLYAHRAVPRRKVSDSALNLMRALFQAAPYLGLMLAQIVDELLARIFPNPLGWRSEEHTSELQSRLHLVCRLLLEKKKKKITNS